MEIQNEKQHWMNLKELEEGFHAGPEFSDLPPEIGADRRSFLKLMGASIALATTSCVRRPVQKIVPYVKRPEEIIPGVANEYASVWVDGGEGLGITVKTREGRPIKIEGNRLFPINQGSMTVKSHAHILSLYDPDRLKGPRKISRGSDFHQIIEWSELDQQVALQLKKGKVAILTSSLASPTTKKILIEFLKGFNGELFIWDTLGADDIFQGQNLCFNDDSTTLPRYRFDKAQMIVSIDTDFLGTFLSPAEYSRQFSLGRQPGNNFSKLICFESIYSLTGANADERIRIRPSEQLNIVMGLLYEIIINKKLSSYSKQDGVLTILKPYASIPEQYKEISQIASDLWKFRGQSLVITGGTTTRTESSSLLQIAVNFLNHILDNEGITIDTSLSRVKSFDGTYSELAQLIQKMKRGEISTLIIHGTNPGYSLPTNSGFKEALKKVEMVIYTGDRIDETGEISSFVTPDHHSMENWGDAEIQEGIFCIQQPTIRPLYDTRAFQDSLIIWSKLASRTLGSQKDWHSYLKNHWEEYIYKKYGGGTIGAGSFETFWIAVLQQGVFDISMRLPSRNARFFQMNALSKIKEYKGAKKGYELVLYPTIALGDGKLANLSWLQELPDPVTKIVWDNYLSISLAASKKENLEEGDIVQLKVGDKTIEIPVHIQPGLHDEVITLALGYGRRKAGRVGNDIGQNGFELAQFNNGQILFSSLEASITKTNKKYELANTQGHHRMEGRAIVAEATLKEYLSNPESGIHRHKIFSIWPEHKYTGHKWAMSIDLSKCTGCSACVIACQSENNIPVVSKKYVLKGREMHWIRIDRYYAGSAENPHSLFQPLLCQQCDNAPCETVCPVVATSHSDEGLNEMIYNRCVGTRYCSNNCHYKVRRFNWFEYSNIEYPLNMALNPSVTTRSRGVMEKCTFCVQRIKEAKNRARDKDTIVNDGDIVVACEQSCPTKAIVFGDINDPKSRVHQMFQDKRSYKLLEEFNAEPAIRYLSKIRNSEMESSKENKEGHS